MVGLDKKEVIVRGCDREIFLGLQSLGGIVVLNAETHRRD
jgi:hypothetical protein